jgi:hydroxyethylthiazole kinase
MLISPPFLPSQDGRDEAKFLNIAMHGSERGVFPISQKLSWHGGRHLLAPKESNGTALPVRAIADGTVVFTRSRTSAESPSHALNYGGGYTSDSVVVIRHTTDIGADAQNAPVTVRFYSVYMHLHSIDPTVQAGRTIHRKDLIGQAGHIYGEPGLIHFEICCDRANLSRLVGRNKGSLDLEKDGRIDAVYGDMHVRLPAGTPIYVSQPSLGSPDAPSASKVLTKNTEDWFIGIEYVRGNAILTTRSADGRELSAAHTEPNHGEYQLYERAKALSKALQEVNQITQQSQAAFYSPSACFELLRFGRVLTPNTLEPATIPHWRQVTTPAGIGWGNLNAAGTTKYSDADFPSWRNWALVDDSADRDSRCDSQTIQKILNVGNDGKTTIQEGESRLALPEVRRRLSRTICRFPSEWEGDTIDARWDWLKKPTPENHQPLTGQDWEKFRAHVQALCFDCPEIFAAKWCFDPRTFIEHFKKCGWMSLAEMAQLLPSKIKSFNLSWKEAISRLMEGHPPALTKKPATMPAKMQFALNVVFRKYGMLTSIRQAHFFGQILQETGLLTYNAELGDERYFRTMYENITNEEAGKDYDEPGSIAWRLRLVYRKVDGQNTLITREQYAVQRPQRVRDKAAGLGNNQTGDGARFKGRGVIQLTGRSNYTEYSRYCGRDYTTDDNQMLLATEALVSTDVSAFYWISKILGKGTNIHRLADKGASNEDVAVVTIAVNGGKTHLSERQEYFRYVWSILRDAPTPEDTVQSKRQTMPKAPT